MVPNAEGEVVESWPVLRHDESEDHAESAGEGREVHLEALRELGPVTALGIAGPKLGARDAVSLVVALGSFSGISASRRRPRQILAEGVGIEASGETQLAVQRLPLAVWGEHLLPVLCHEVLPLLRGCVPSAGALLDRFPGRIGHQGERSVRALVGDDVLPGSVAAEPDVGMLHGKKLATAAAGGRDLGVIGTLFAIPLNLRVGCVDR